MIWSQVWKWERSEEEGGGVWGILDWMGHFIRKRLRLGFGIWTEIPLFWAVAPVRDLTQGDDGWLGVGFDHGGRQG